MTRVRFAPSPTGTLHVGGALSALANRTFGEWMLLRIDDTDAERNRPGGEEGIIADLRWLGIDWDEGPVRQSDRAGRHLEVAREAGLPQRFEGVMLWRDDGSPTFHLASVVDDADFQITHVIRGSDHVSNTPKQLQILAALGHEPPVYAHVPDVLGADGKKLSKRHGATSVDEFRAAGYVPEALMNFLALLGWAPDGETTIMSREELIERFSLDRVGSSPATLDYEKLDWMNGVYLRALPPDEYADRLVAYLEERGYYWPEERVRAAAPLVQEKIERFGQFPEFAGFLFREVDPDPALLDGDAPVVAAARDELAAVEPFSAAEIEAALRGLAERLELSPRKAFQPIRVAVTGSKISPGLFESLELLGKDESLRRLSSAAAGGEA
jgi:glutamyl-tRNA synthetase